MQLLQPFLCFDTSLLHIEVDSVEDCALHWIYIDINNAYLFICIFMKKKKKISLLPQSKHNIHFV